MALTASTHTTADEYLAFERAAEGRHEWIDGQVVAMSGGSRAHDRINSNLLYAFMDQLRGPGRCTTFTSNMRVKAAESGLYTYPNVTVVCGEPTFEDEEVDVLVNPTLLVEILSPTTAAYDRTEKWARYRSLPSLREYLLVEQDRVLVERYVRRDDGSWIFSETADLEAVLSLDSIGCDLAVVEVYRGVDLGS